MFANPKEHGFEGTPEEVTQNIVDIWIAGNPQRTCAIAYCISADGFEHIHAVFEDVKALRFSVVKKLFPLMHIEPTKGNKRQAEDYINKKPPFDETGEKILYIARHGEIRGRQGMRVDLEIIEDLIHQGMRPNEIFDLSLKYRRYDKIIRDAYYQKRTKETPIKRDLSVYWHFGDSGTGKSHTAIELAKKYGEDDIYIVSEYKNGFDKYNGEKKLFLDELRNQLSYDLLLSILDGYKIQIPCRYSNIYSLWDEVHITSVLPPEKVYSDMVKNHKSLDTIDQLKRRISIVVYHYIKNSEYLTYEQAMSEYTTYEDLIKLTEIDK